MKAGVKLLNLHQSFAVCFDYSDTTCVFVPNCAQNLLLMALRYLTDKSALVPPPPPPSRRQSRTGRCGRSGVLAAGPGAAAGPRAPPSPLPVALIARPGPAEPSVRRGCRPGRHGGRAGPPPGPAAGAAGGRRAAAGCRRLLQLEGQASLQRDISRRTASFQYELLSNQSAAGPDFKKKTLIKAMCRPCDNVELLMAICSSDFVVKGSIRNVSHDSENHMSQVDVNVQKVYRQKNRIFQQDEASGEWRGPIRTLLQCKVKKGAGDFLFTGNEHFGEAWLGCAPRFKDFSFIYHAARERRVNPCEFQLN
uniref:Meteorin-like protein n=1 Tax=Cairina moschata TaxID=8855 RepID=A0A8C3CJ63_CAIMO